MAQESDAKPLTPEVLPQGFEIILLPGHFFDMVGFRTGDDVVYLADCLSSRETLDKYQITFIYDVAAYLETLERVKTMRARMFVPAHAGAAEDIAPLAQYNIDKVWEIAEKITSLCAEPIGFEALLQKVFEAFGLTMNFEQYVLVGSKMCIRDRAITPVAVPWTVPRMRTVRAVLAASVPRETEPVQGWKVAPPSSEYWAFTSCAGMGSVSSTFCASPGPRFSTFSV